MTNSNVRKSLNYQTYIQQCRGLHLAAKENLDLLKVYMKESRTLENNYKELGLLNSTMLLYAVSIELVVKARGLYEELEVIKSKEIKNFQQFLERWKGNGHNFLKIIEHYNVKVTEEEMRIFKEYINFSHWAGRFPFPKIESEIIKYENTELKRNTLGSHDYVIIDNFINNQINIMVH